MTEAAPTIINHVPSLDELRTGLPSGTVDPSFSDGGLAPGPIEVSEESFYCAPTPSDLAVVNESVAEIVSGPYDTETKATALSILTRGEDRSGQRVGGVDLVARGARDEAHIRDRLAYLAVDAPDTYAAIMAGSVIGFHGTRSSALAGILSTGKLMAAEAINAENGRSGSGPSMVTGEHVAQRVPGQSSISFSHLGAVESAGAYAQVEDGSHKRSYAEALEGIETRASAEEAMAHPDAYEFGGRAAERAAQHAAAKAHRLRELAGRMKANPGSLESVLQQNDFPVLIGVSEGFVGRAADNPDPNIRHPRTIAGSSDMGEFRPMATEIPIAALPVVAVPREFLSGTQKLMGMFGAPCKVVPLEDIYWGPSSPKHGDYEGAWRPGQHG